jgi:hypothetical protein
VKLIAPAASNQRIFKFSNLQLALLQKILDEEEKKADADEK